MQLSGVAQLVGGAFHVGSLADAAAVGPALQALTTSALPHPLLATLASPRIKASQQVLLTTRHQCSHTSHFGCTQHCFAPPKGNCMLGHCLSVL